MGVVVSHYRIDESSGEPVREERPIAISSKTFNKHQANYSVTEKEGLAVVWALDKYRAMLLGRSFILETDHSALRQLLMTKDPTGRIARWVLKLQEYAMDVRFRPGDQNANADYASRETAENL
ncbi:unnamed protein product, partial [Heterosigma akashiwo]